MPRVGETWRTRYGLSVRIIADDAKGPYPLVGLIDWPQANREKAWTFSVAGINCDPCDDGMDLVEQIVSTGEALPPGWVNQPLEDILKSYERADV